MELAKSFDPHAIEQHWYPRWESAGHFQMGRAEGADPYCILLPPPNVTGTLHMGHAVQHTLMDALTRYHRMQGDNTLWQPGTDHAGIATQIVVERQLDAQGISRHDLGREKFLEKVWDWKEHSGSTITRQMRRLGTSPAWERERFTMDAGLSEAVTEVFVRLYNEGLIYRGKRLVNWDPVLQTAVSDLEVISTEEEGFLWEIAYPLESGAGHLCVATTRPEAFQKDVHLPDFAHLPIEDLNDAEIAAFLRDWYRGLHEDDESAADRAARELVEAIGRARPDILRLARNPLMLTLLAVVHWNRGRLPEGRADLYRAVLEHLAEWAKDGDHPCPPKVRLRRLSLLAFAMQAGKGGQTLQLDLGAAASHIHSTFASDRPRDDALEFLGREQAASGILTLHQGQVRFWHRSFQEFLAAWRLAGAADKDLPQVKTFLYVPEWRESIQLLTGLWYPDQHDRLDSLLAMLVEHAAGKNTLPRKACAAGILGAVLADLAPGGYRLPAEAQTSYRKLLDEVMAIFRPGAHALIGLRDRAAAADALALAHDPRLLTPHDPDYWIPVPSGIAVIGEGPDERRVPIERGFRIGRFPVTVDEYRKYREDPRHSSPPPQPDDWEEQLRHPSRPVVFITWEAADRYCKHFGCQLPSEVQWEYAARGEEGRPYPWGEAPPGQSRAIFDQALEHAAPVGLCPEGATPLGVTDMAGSCWEWTATEWASGHHVVKGGSWYNNAAGMRCSYRDGGHDVVDGSDNGFRCVREGLP